MLSHSLSCFISFCSIAKQRTMHWIHVNMASCKLRWVTCTYELRYFLSIWNNHKQNLVTILLLVRMDMLGPLNKFRALLILEDSSMLKVIHFLFFFSPIGSPLKISASLGYVHVTASVLYNLPAWGC